MRGGLVKIGASHVWLFYAENAAECPKRQMHCLYPDDALNSGYPHTRIPVYRGMSVLKGDAVVLAEYSLEGFSLVS